MGVLATRTPHRPNPIGLSLCQVEAVEGRMLVLSGVDIVDGSPVLDIKPYVPFCEACPGAKAPEWVAVCPHSLRCVFSWLCRMARSAHFVRVCLHVTSATDTQRPRAARLLPI
jgi:tRNA-methyltransferase O